jgi:hypothetical protein
MSGGIMIIEMDGQTSGSSYESEKKALFASRRSVVVVVLFHALFFFSLDTADWWVGRLCGIVFYIN